MGEQARHLPPYWRNETSGLLEAAVWSYLNRKTGRSEESPTDEQIVMLKSYLVQWVDAPCWKDPAPGGIERLRRQAREIQSAEDIDKFLAEALDVGIDPL